MYFCVQTVWCYPLLPVCHVFLCPNSALLPIPTCVSCIFVSKQCIATHSYLCVVYFCVQTVHCYPFLPVCRVFLCPNSALLPIPTVCVVYFCVQTVHCYPFLPVCHVFLCLNNSYPFLPVCVVYFCVCWNDGYTHSYQYVVFFCVQTVVWWLPVLGIFNMHVDVWCMQLHSGAAQALWESALKVDSGRKIPCPSGESNPCQYWPWLFTLGEKSLALWGIEPVSALPLAFCTTKYSDAKSYPVFANSGLLPPPPPPHPQKGLGSGGMGYSTTSSLIAPFRGPHQQDAKTTLG